MLSFDVLYFGDHNLNCGVREYQGEENYQIMVQEIVEAFSKGDFADTIRLLDRHFGASTYSLKTLFRDEQRKISSLIFDSILQDTEAVYRQLYENHAPMLRFLKDIGIPAPKALYVAAEEVLNAGLQRAFESEKLQPEDINSLLEEAIVQGISLDENTLEYSLRRNIERLAGLFYANPGEISPLRELEAAVGITRSLPFRVNLRRVQNIFYEVLQSIYPEFREKAMQGDEGVAEWMDSFTSLGEKLSVCIK